MGNLSFAEMSTFPVLHYYYSDTSVYLDTTHPAYAANIFAAVVSYDDNGDRSHQEFVPCSQIENQTDYLQMDYASLYTSQKIVDNSWLEEYLNEYYVWWEVEVS